MSTGRITAIASELPSGLLTSAALASLYADWSAEKIVQKTGVAERRITSENETALDLAEAACRRLFAQGAASPGEIDFLLVCTQTPDHPLPGDATLLHHRLGLRTDCGVLDYGLGCSGFVYGLALVEGLIATGAADQVLLVTADTYSKLIHPADRSTRTLFGDGAAATLVRREAETERAIGPFVFGADGRGARHLKVEAGGARTPLRAGSLSDEEQGPEHLHMDGAAVLAFALKAVPAAARKLMEKSGRTIGDYDLVVLHQASALLLDQLQRKLGVDDARFVRHLERCGNTVSSTIPLALEPYLQTQTAGPRRVLLAGFGVGFAWAAGEILI